MQASRETMFSQTIEPVGTTFEDGRAAQNMGGSRFRVREFIVATRRMAAQPKGVEAAYIEKGSSQ